MNIPDKAAEAAREALVKRGLLAVGDAAEIALEAAAPAIAAQENLDIACEMPGLTRAQATWLAKRRGDPLWLV